MQMAQGEKVLPMKPEISEKQIVEQLAEDVAIHGWKIGSYTTRQDIDKETRSLTITMSRSTGAQQTEMPLSDEDKQRAKRRRGTAEGDTPKDEE